MWKSFMRVIIGLMSLCLWMNHLMASESVWPLERAPINIQNKASLQRGAKYFVNYCQGCHAAAYMRYSQMAKGVGLVDAKGDIIPSLVLNNLVFVGDKIMDPMKTAMNAEQSKEWFGVAPPDLTLVARRRGADWLYTYLRSFYVDPAKPWGVNNALFPEVAMPHVWLDLQGVQEPIYHIEKVEVNGKLKEHKTLQKLELTTPGKLKSEEYDRMVADVVNFLTYIAEPVQTERKHLGIRVLLFLSVLGIVAYLLKREYWRDVR